MPRVLAILGFLGVQALVGAVLMTVLVGIVTTFDGPTMWGWLFNGDLRSGVGAALVLVCILQAIVLLPVRRRRPRRARGVSIGASLVVASLLVGLLAGAFVLAVCEAFSERSAATYLAGGVVTLTAWGAALVMFLSFVRNRPDASRESLLHRIAKIILQGTAFEVVALIPFDVMIRKRTTCYCVTGTVFGWALSFAVGLVVLGPAVLLPILARKREPWYAERCDACATPHALAVAHAAGYREPTEERCGTCGDRVPIKRS